MMYENRYEARFNEMNEELTTMMKLMRELYGIRPITTRELHWYDDPENFFQLAKTAGTIAAGFNAMAELLHEMGCEAADGDERGAFEY